MVVGIILIVIGVIGSIVTLVYGIKFLKKNNILLKSDYVGIVSEKINQSRSEEFNDTDVLDSDTDSTDILDNDMQHNLSLDTEVLDFEDEIEAKSTKVSNNSMDTEILM